MNSYLQRREGIGKAGRKSEKKLAKRLGLSQTPASGAAISKGDLRGNDVLVEAKSTVNASIGLQHAWLVKIAEEAALVGKEPALTVSFTDPQGNPKRFGSWVMIPERLYRELLQSIAEGRS